MNLSSHRSLCCPLGVADSTHSEDVQPRPQREQLRRAHGVLQPGRRGHEGLARHGGPALRAHQPDPAVQRHHGPRQPVGPEAGNHASGPGQGRDGQHHLHARCQS